MESMKKNLILYWTLLSHDDWKLHIAATAKGVCYVGSPNQPFEEMSDWAAVRFPGAAWEQDDERLHDYVEELQEYFQGKRTRFTLPFDYYGTPFQLAVWEALQSIPYGLTQSYSEIAAKIHKPAAVRAVGAAIGANPLLITVPCHRVIGKNGALTGYRGGMAMKTRLLQLEREGMNPEGESANAYNRRRTDR